MLVHALRLRRHRDRNRAFGRELDRVGDQVGHALPHAHRIMIHRRQVKRRIKRQRQPFALGLCAEQLHRAANRLHHIARRGRDLKLARLDLGQVQHVVQQNQQRFAGVENEIDLLGMLRLKLLGSHDLREPKHAIQGRANLVAYVGEKLRLRNAGGFSRILCRREVGQHRAQRLLVRLKLSGKAHGLRFAFGDGGLRHLHVADLRCPRVRDLLQVRLTRLLQARARTHHHEHCDDDDHQQGCNDLRRDFECSYRQDLRTVEEHIVGTPRPQHPVALRIGLRKFDRRRERQIRVGLALHGVRQRRLLHARFGRQHAQAMRRIDKRIIAARQVSCERVRADRRRDNAVQLAILVVEWDGKHDAHSVRVLPGLVEHSVVAGDHFSRRHHGAFEHVERRDRGETMLKPAQLLHQLAVLVDLYFRRDFLVRTHRVRTTH